MPIHCPVSFKVLTPEEFTALDYQIMAHVFASQNELGRLCDETIYEADVAARLQSAGFVPVRRQVPLTVTFQDFAKTYFLDLVVNDCALYELKTAAALVNEHKAQLLHYIFLLGLRSGKLINFRPAKVQAEFASTRLTHTDRRAVTIDDSRWHPLGERCSQLYACMMQLLQEWGGYLEIALYEEALAHFLGGATLVRQPVIVSRAGVQLGVQPITRHAPDIAFKITAVTEDIATMEAHLRKLLVLLPVRAVQWINLSHSTIQFITLEKP